MAITLVPKLKKESEKLLKEALTVNFDSVIIFGFNNDKQTLSTSASPTVSRLEILGALEAAKYHLWKSE